MGVVSGTQDTNRSPASPRILKQHSGRRVVPSGTAQTAPTGVQQNKPFIWATRTGPICIKANYPKAKRLQLETRPLAKPWQDWSMTKGFANPPWALVGQVLAQFRAQHAQVVLVAPVWKIQPWYSNLLHMLVDHLRLLHHSPLISNPGSSSNRTTPTASRMAYFREKYAREQLSEEATKPWRTKTNKSYDSLFNKWSHWCSERGSDPISGPIGEVVSCLAYLFKKGYQYQSLNAYRSAISSTHN